MLSNIHKWLMKLVSKQVYYFNGRLYKFVTDQRGDVTLEEASECNPKFLIVSPKYVSAEAEEYPVPNKKELHKILSLKTARNVRFSVMDISKDSGAQVLKYTFKDDIPSAWMKIPEIALLGQFSTSDTVLEIEHCEEGERGYYLAKAGKQLKYAPKLGLITSLERLKVAIGVSTGQVKHVDWSQKSELLNTGLMRLGFKGYFPFLPQRDEIKIQKNLLMSLVPAGIAVFSYMVIVSAALIAQEAHLTNKMQAQSQQLGNLLDLSSSSDKKTEVIESLSEFVSQRQSTLGLWQVLAPLFADLRIDQINTQGNRLVFRAQGESATQILENFRQSELVDDVKFESPVLSLRNGERFTISFILNSDQAKSVISR